MTRKQPATGCPNLAATLRAARLYARLSQAELATRTGIPRATLARLETGERAVSGASLMAIERALGVQCLNVAKRQSPYHADMFRAQEAGAGFVPSLPGM